MNYLIQIQLKIKIKQSLILQELFYIPGKTCVIALLLGLDFFEGTLTTIGIDKRDIYYTNKNNQYKLKFWDTAGAERFISSSLKLAKS